jgi:hypothetical protein
MDLNALSEPGKVLLLIVAVGLFAHAKVRRSWQQHARDPETTKAIIATIMGILAHAAASLRKNKPSPRFKHVR